MIIALIIGFGIVFLAAFFDHEGFGKVRLCYGFCISFLLFMTICIFVIVFELTEPKQEEFITTYALKEYYKNQYYSISADGNVVSVWMQDGESWKKESFSTDMVEFRLHTGSAEITIEGEKYIEPSRKEQILYFRKTLNSKDINGEPLYEDIYKKIIISVPIV